MACCTTVIPIQKRGLEFDLLNSPKRRKCGTMYTLKESAVNATIIDAKEKSTSPFEKIKNDEFNNSSNIMNRIRFEAKRLLRRHQIQITNNNKPISNDNDKNLNEPSFKFHLNKNSCDTTSITAATTTNNDQMSSNNVMPIVSKELNFTSSLALKNDVPIFTMSQVTCICEKFLREHEASLREQYDTILNQKLNEQYDSFVKFTHEQIQKKFENSHFSYVS